jgi:hypothetical protein
VDYGGVRGASQHPAGGLQLGAAALVLESLLRLGTLAALARAHRIPMALPAESSASPHSHKEQGSMIRRYIIWRNHHADDRRLHALVAGANVA